jgi:hypothetical protein
MSPQKKKELHQRLRLVCPRGPHKRHWLHWWVKTYFGIHIPDKQVCADHDAPFTAFADAFFNESSKGMYNNAFVCHGSRLFGGKTFLEGLLATARMVLKGAECFVLGGSKDQTTQMREYLFQTSARTRGVWWDWPRAPKHLIGQITTDTIKLKNGAKVTALAASQKETRSKHGTDLIGDEVDEMDWDVLKSAFGQTIRRKDVAPLTFLASTWQHPEGTLMKVFDHAEQSGWGVYQWCYRETHVSAGGHVTDEDLDAKRREMTEGDWQNEVELQRPASDELIFSRETIEFTFDDRYYGYDTPNGNFTDGVGHDYILIPPNEGDAFYSGTDWAKRQDFTIINTMIENHNGPDLLAAWCMRQKEPWPIMFEHHNSRIRQYGGPSIFDGTGMAGDMIEDHLTVDSRPFDFSKRKELHEAYSSLITAIESGEYRLPNIPYLRKKFELLTRGQVYESTRTSKKNHTPDPFVALALARKAQLEGTFQILMGRAW